MKRLSDKEIKDALKNIGLVCPNLVSFIEMRIKNNVLGLEYTDEKEASLPLIEEALEKIGISPGEYAISGEVNFVLRFSPTKEAPRDAKVIDIPLVKKEVY
jgi:hypothetical protein